MQGGLIIKQNCIAGFSLSACVSPACSEARGSWGIHWCVATCQSGDSGPVPQQPRQCVCVHKCVCVSVCDRAALNDWSVGGLGAPRSRLRLLLRRNTFTQEAH